MLEFTVIGNLGRDAEVKTKDGHQFVAFNVAHTDKWTDEAGQNHETTEWVSCTMNGDGGKILPFLKSGTRVYVSGRGSTRVYSSPKDRMMKAGANINVSRIELVGGISEDVPGELINPANGALYKVFKAYYLHPDSVKDTGIDSNGEYTLIDRKQNTYTLTGVGFVTRNVVEEAPQEQAQ